MDQFDVSVIVPTFREADNLPVLVPRVAAALAGAGLSGEIIVVDDNSPDATRSVCEELAKSYPVRLEVRTAERGLSSAVVHGMRLAQGRVFVVMDADLSHPPEKVPDLVAAVAGGDCDFVIGSRYVAGGSTEDGWGLFRWLNSKVATALAWPLTTTRDPMAGFFALRRETFAAAKHLDPIGYKIGLELLVKARCQTVREVPIAFANRLHGESKLTLKEQVNYLRHLKRLYEFRFGRVFRPLSFVAVGSTGMIVDLAIFALLLGVMPKGGARAAAIWAAMSWNFMLNRRVTFSHARHRPALRQYLLFCLSCSLGAAVSWSVSMALPALLSAFEGQNLLAAVCGIVGGTVTNYLLSSRVVFRVAAGLRPTQPSGGVPEPARM